MRLSRHRAFRSPWKGSQSNGKQTPGDRLDNALMDIHTAADTLLQIGEARKDRILLAYQLLGHHQKGEEAAGQMQQLDAKRIAHPSV
jgi:hypothetical protein